MQTYWINLHARGFGKTAEDAYFKAVERLVDAADKLRENMVPIDPGIRVAMDDPGGGGGGPCAPEYIKIEVNVTASGLPEARAVDD